MVYVNILADDGYYTKLIDNVVQLLSNSSHIYKFNINLKKGGWEGPDSAPLSTLKLFVLTEHTKRITVTSPISATISVISKLKVHFAYQNAIK